MKIIIGEEKPYNSFRLKEIKDSYVKQYIKEFTSIKELFKWLISVTRPLLGNKFLAILNDSTTYIRNTNKLIGQLEEYNSHPYVDIMWIVPNRVNIRDIPTDSDIVNLKLTFKEDFKLQLTRDMPRLTSAGLDRLLKKTGYSWDTYNLYREELKEANPVTPANIDAIVKKDITRSAHEVLQMIVFRKRHCILQYYNLCKRYSRGWVNNYISDQIDKIIDVKIQIANKTTGLSKVRSDSELSKYTFIISQVPITELFILKTLLSKPKGVELYVSYNLKTLTSIMMDDFSKERLVYVPINRLSTQEV